jgi:hypothetical protein
MDRCQTGRCKATVFWRLARLEKRLDLGIASRNATRDGEQTVQYARQDTFSQSERRPFSTNLLIGELLLDTFIQRHLVRFR